MAAERRQQISELYHAARERSPEERSAYLKEACAGDDALCAEVESLLRYDAASADFLERPAAVVGPVAMPSPDWSVDNKHIVYMDGGDLWTLPMTGTDPLT